MEQLKIALDYDGTYTKNMWLWDAFITMCKNSGVDIRIVTCRYEKNRIDKPINIPIHYTNMKSKWEHCDEIDWHPDIWIDDMPETILRRSALEFLEKFGFYHRDE